VSPRGCEVLVLHERGAKVTRCPLVTANGPLSQGLPAARNVSIAKHWLTHSDEPEEARRAFPLEEAFA